MVRLKASSLLEVLIAMLLLVISFLIFSSLISSVSLFQNEIHRLQKSSFIYQSVKEKELLKENQVDNLIDIVEIQKQYDDNVILIEVGLYKGEKEIYSRKRLKYE
ncbi:hypothetical protein N9H19_02445 [Flavobacteriales bacterium]|nr:hypothetical protein [Flavobacteriales bacterium]